MRTRSDSGIEWPKHRKKARKKQRMRLYASGVAAEELKKEFERGICQ